MDLAYSFEQMAGIAAVLGGLAFTAAASLLGVGASRGNGPPFKRSASLTIASAVTSTLFLIFAALCWSVIGAIVAGTDVGSRVNALPDDFLFNSRMAFASLGVGIAALFFSVGASGWIASKAMGVFTTTIAVLIGVGVFLILDWAAAY